MSAAGKLGILLAAGLAVAPFAARAQTFELSYTGTDSGFGYTQGTTTGTGSFTLTAGALSAFTLTITETAGPGAGDAGASQTLTWGYNDVLSFIDTLSNGNITSLSILTDTQPADYTVDQQFADNYFPFSVDGAATFNLDTGPVTLGTLTVTPASLPEPASMAVLAMGLAALLAARARSKPRFF